MSVEATHWSYKYFYFVEEETTTKTALYSCRSLNGSVLGIVKWFGRWRQYCFWPTEQTIFNVGCLQDICHFIDTVAKVKAQRPRAEEGGR